MVSYFYYLVFFPPLVIIIMLITTNKTEIIYFGWNTFSPNSREAAIAPVIGFIHWNTATFDTELALERAVQRYRQTQEVRERKIRHIIP